MTSGDAPGKINANAWVALVSAVLGFTCFWGVGGLVAVLLGMSALREIERSGGQQSGRGLSIAAIALGTLSMALVVIGVGLGIAMLTRANSTNLSPPAAPIHAPAPTLVPPSLPNGRRGAAPAASPATGIRETMVGKVRLIDLHERGSLSSALQRQRELARQAGETLLLFVVASDCLPCNGVALALPDARMQQALAGTRLVRVDMGAFTAELTRLGVPDSIPGFALLSDAGVVDYVHGGEWDADIPENIAPVLAAFVKRKYGRRRHPYRGPERADETAL